MKSDRCVKCGSEDVIPDVQVPELGYFAETHLALVENPGAIFSINASISIGAGRAAATASWGEEALCRWTICCISLHRPLGCRQYMRQRRAKEGSGGYG